MTGRWWTEYFRGERLLGRGRVANDLLVLPKTRPGLRQHLTRLFPIGSRAGDNVFHRKIPFPFSRSYLLLESACGRLCPTFSRKGVASCHAPCSSFSVSISRGLCWHNNRIRPATKHELSA